MLAFQCPGCGKSLKVKDELAGKKVKCPGCAKPVAVPEPASSFNPPPGAPIDEKTLPPKPSQRDEERTLPREGPIEKKDSVSDVEALTGLGAGHGQSTQAYPGNKPISELTEFLSPPQENDEIGRLGVYRILKVLGQGGMGVVFKAHDPRLDRLVALKAMLPALASLASAKERFFREAKAAAALKHPHVVAIYDVGEDRGAPYLAMEFLEGEPLDVRLRREGKLSIPEVLRIGGEVAKGLSAAHKRGLIHRDIKPANIWLEAADASHAITSRDRKGAEPLTNVRGSEFHAKILDFGLARAMGSETGLTQTGAIVGTPQYMAPEQAAGKKDIDHRCDLFSLGCVLYRMSTGQLPFKGDDTLAIISSLAMDKPKEPSKVDKSVPQPLSKLIVRLLAKNPDDRPQSADEVAEALAEIATTFGGEPTATRSSGKWPVGSGQQSRTGSWKTKKMLIGGGVLGVLVLGLVVFFLASRERQRPEESLPKTFTNSLGMEFVLIPKGKSWLGGSGGKPGDKEVDVMQDFYLGKYEVTQEEWEKVTGSNPSQFKAVAGASKEDQKRFPVEMVSWDDCQVFIERLNKQAKDADWVYRLPTGVEWEYACRGGPMQDKLESAFDYYFEKPSNTLLPDQANFEHGKGLKRTCKVGSYQPNRLGLYDMHGNVWEWCGDEVKVDKGASLRVSRGGSWHLDAGHCRAAFRDTLPPSYRHFNLGLRLARVPVGKEIVKIIAPAEKKPDVNSRAFKNSLGMEFVLVPKGKSWLGGGDSRMGDKEVEIKEDFYLGKYEVTQEEWEKVTGINPSVFKAVAGVTKEDQKRFPVETVSWDDCQAFIKRLNTQAKEAGWVYRLPMEMEWEYACRGGPMMDKFESAFDFYLDKATNTLLADQANFNNVLKRTCKVGSYRPNKLGLHDMYGNVREWCADEIPEAAARRVHRNGGLRDDAGICRTVARSTTFGIGDFLGLRLARVPIGKEIVKIIAPAEKKPSVGPKQSESFKNSLGMELAYIPPGKFWMGSPTTEAKRDDDEQQHQVEISAFHMSKHEVTQAQFQQLMGFNPSAFSEKGMESAKVAGMNTTDFPVENVTWREAVNFCQKLSQMPAEKTAGRTYRLPTEAEWEYACRAGTTTPFHFGASASATQANFWGHMPYGGAPEAPSLARTTRVGSYKPNAFGLFDMHGNVSEWCADYYDKNHYKSSSRVNPSGPLKGKDHVFRGGGCFNYGEHVRAAFRGHFIDQRKDEKDRTIGFRVVCNTSAASVQ